MARRLAVLQAILLLILGAALIAFSVALWLYFSGRAQPQNYFDARFVGIHMSQGGGAL